MSIRVDAAMLDQMNALRKMQKAFPGEESQFKERKAAWWAAVRRTHNIPKGVKLKLGTESGILLHSATSMPYEPAGLNPAAAWPYATSGRDIAQPPVAPVQPRWLKMTPAAVATALKYAADCYDIEADDEGVEEHFTATIPWAVPMGGDPDVITASGFVYIKADGE